MTGENMGYEKDPMQTLQAHIITGITVITVKMSTVTAIQNIKNYFLNSSTTDPCGIEATHQIRQRPQS